MRILQLDPLSVPQWGYHGGEQIELPAGYSEVLHCTSVVSNHNIDVEKVEVESPIKRLAEWGWKWVNQRVIWLLMKKIQPQPVRLQFVSLVEVSANIGENINAVFFWVVEEFNHALIPLLTLVVAAGDKLREGKHDVVMGVWTSRVWLIRLKSPPFRAWACSQRRGSYYLSLWWGLGVRWSGRFSLGRTGRESASGSSGARSTPRMCGTCGPTCLARSNPSKGYRLAFSF